MRNCKFWNALSGWHIQTAAGSEWTIEDSSFEGPNQWKDANGGQNQPGQIMLWGACGSIKLRRNRFIMPRASALTTYAFSCTGNFIAEDNYVSGVANTVFGLPAGAQDINNQVRNSA